MMAVSRLFLVVSLTALFSIALLSYATVAATNPADISRSTLVVLDDLAQRATYSRYFSSLAARGHSLKFVQAEQDVAFVEWGEYQYDSLILFAPKAESFGGSLSVESILDFIDEGRDVIVAVSSDSTWISREIAESVGVLIDDEGTFVIDHFNFDARDSGSHTLVASSNVASLPNVVGTSSFKPVLFRGVGLTLAPENQLVFPVLSGSATSYSAVPGEPIETLRIAGSSTVLVASIQARNNARVTIFGSLDMISDSFFTSNVDTSSTKSERSGNEAFVTEVSKWTLHERGMLRMRNVVHHLPGEEHHPEMYVINQKIEYSLTIEQLEDGKWVPFLADDVQLEFRMLDPYVRVTLSHDSKGHYSTIFTAPDVYGIYTFSLEYHRQGLSNLVDKQRIVVRPFRHDEYERFIVAAYPYYAAAFSMIGSVVVLTVIFLLHRDK